MTTSNSPRVVLIVDDEIQIRRFLRAGLELDGFVVLETATVAESITAATLQSPDLIVLDLGLPDADGAELVERVRTWSEVPIIVLSVQSDEPEKVRLLELGADDYLVKPFGMAELLARSHAALRRYVRTATGEPIIKAGPLTIDLASRRVYLEQERISLTRKEYQLLQVLGQHAGNVVTHQHLLKELWGTSQVHLTQYLRILVRKLRQKIESDPTRPQIISTEMGVGYRLVQPDSSVVKPKWELCE
jgi:two-component system, OmpR family, KDP operon response regulator KdpE